jgi:hypothetical protein
MNGLKKSVAAILVAASMAATAMAPYTAKASEAGRRNTTYALGALTGVLAAKHKWIPAGVAAVGTGVAYHNYQAAINARHRREHRIAYRHAYRAGYNSGYHTRVHHRRVVHHRRHK